MAQKLATVGTVFAMALMILAVKTWAAPSWSLIFTPEPPLILHH